MSDLGDIELAEDKKKRSVCGQCWQFGYMDEHNFGRCEIDAFSDGYVIHKLYRSQCVSYKKRKCFPSFLRKSDIIKYRETQVEMVL